jgi:long-chain acyl-CoA synthetase
MAEQPWLAAYPAVVDWQADIPALPLGRILADSAVRYPGNPCIDFLGRKYTYAEVDAMANRAARGFRALGVGKGTRVGLFLPNCPQHVVSFFGILRAGGTVVNYSPLYAADQIRHQIADSETEIMVTLNLKALYPKIRPLVGTTSLRRLVVGNMPEVLPFPKSVLFPLAKRADIARVIGDAAELEFSELVRNDGALIASEIDPGKTVAVLQYTGGTTGTPKGAMLTHANLYANVHQIMLWLEDVEEGRERIMGALPFFHVFAMTAVMNFALYIGGEILMHPRFNLDAVLKDIHKKRPTLVPGVPTMFAAINQSPLLRQLDLTSIRYCISGGAPLPVEVKERFERLSSCKLVEGYGLTETSPVATCNPLSGVNKQASVGLPLPGTVVEVRDPDDPGRVVKQGERGEICISGPQVMAGYWNQHEATRDVLVNGRLRTGDIGYMDEEGYVFLVDRIKDLILTSGFNVYPRNIEEAIYEHEAVAEVIVIGVRDDLKGQAVKAFIKLAVGASLTGPELLTFLGPRLGRHELPREIEFRTELPKTLVGKLSKKELVEEEEAKLAVAGAAPVAAPEAAGGA